MKIVSAVGLDKQCRNFRAEVESVCGRVITLPSDCFVELCRHMKCSLECIELCRK